MDGLRRLALKRVFKALDPTFTSGIRTSTVEHLIAKTSPEQERFVYMVITEALYQDLGRFGVRCEASKLLVDHSKLKEYVLRATFHDNGNAGFAWDPLAEAIGDDGEV